MTSYLAAVLQEFATPPVIRVESQPCPSPAKDELLLQMCAAPINPADLNVLEGKYGELPTLPAIVGNEGVGHVIAIGEGVSGFSEGDLVLPMQRGTWCQKMLIPAQSAIRLPAGTDPQQASMLSVNPATALQLLRSIVPLQSGDWVLQNAANSAVGRSVIQLAKIFQLKTISIVRRPEIIPELQALGGDLVLLEEDDIRTAVKEHCGKTRPKLALNSVGGASALNLANGLANGGTVVTFGAMSRQPLKIPNAMLIFRDLRFTGFWLTRWLKLADAPTIQSVYQELADYVQSGQLINPVAEIIPLTDLVRALEAAAAERRSGKVLLDLQAFLA